MITRDILLETAVHAHDRYKSALPAGSVDGRGMDSYRVFHEAEIALRWMEAMGLQEVTQIGRFGRKEVHQGDRVMIRKGSVLSTTHPRYASKIAGRNYVVTVHNVFEGQVDSHWHDHKVARACRNQRVSWAGEGGYWFETDTANIEIVDRI